MLVKTPKKSNNITSWPRPVWFENVPDDLETRGLHSVLWALLLNAVQHSVQKRYEENIWAAVKENPHCCAWAKVQGGIHCTESLCGLNVQTTEWNFENVLSWAIHVRWFALKDKASKDYRWFKLAKIRSQGYWKYQGNFSFFLQFRWTAALVGRALRLLTSKWWLPLSWVCVLKSCNNGMKRINQLLKESRHFSSILKCTVNSERR